VSIDEHAVATQAELAPDDDDDAILESPALMRIVWADPQYMPEHIAVWSLARFGPIADRAVAKFRAREPAPDHDELERLVVTRQTHVATVEGAFVGGPFVVLLPFAFCGALLAQAQMVFELAAIAGHDPKDRARAAELLVLLETYPSLDEANVALERMARDTKSRTGKRLPRGTRWKMIMRMAYLLQVLGTGPERSRLRVILGWTGLGALFVVGLVLPLVWVPYMGYVTRRSTLRMAQRAQTYYAAGQVGSHGVTVTQKPMVRIGGAAAFVRTTALVVVPIVAGVIAVLTGFNFTGGRWVTALLMLIGLSVVITAGWFGFRWWRRRRRRRRATA
jgi:hypothetical protein